MSEEDGPMPLFSTETEEQLRAQLEERDARIGELTRQVERECNNWALAVKQRDAWRAKFMGMRGDVSRLRQSLGDWRVNELLDRFPDEPSEEGEG